jgi:ArsR family metal-binding transcriptional regulator
MSESLIRSFELRLTTPGCFPGAGWHSAYADMDNDISEALPYLNAELNGCEYDHRTSVLLWTEDDRKYAFRPREIAIAPVADKQEAEELVKRTVGLVNDVWARRHRIVPRFEGKKALPNVLDIFRLLPGTNCRECGYPTCMAFAAAVRGDSTTLPLCPHVSEEEFSNLVS